MYPLFQFFIVGLLPLFATFSPPADPDTWEFQKEVEGIEVYFRESEGSPIKELKISFTVEASLSTIIAVLKDIDAFPEWIYKCKEAELLEGGGPAVLYYNLIDFPWPLSDRDAVCYATYEQDPKTGVIKTRNVAKRGHLPKKNGVVRLQTMEISWTITPEGPKKSHIDYYLQSDPGGSLPNWLINLALDRGPVKSMQAFRKMLKKPAYQNKAIAGVQNF